MNAVAPYLIYMALKDKTSGLTALVIATCVPLAEQIFYFAKKRVIDSFGMLMVGTFVLGAGLALMGGSERVVLLRESFVTGAVGTVFLISLWMRRPLIYSLSLRFIPEANAASQELKWKSPYFRRACRLMSAAWGLLLIGEAAVRSYLIYSLSTSTFLMVSNVVFYSFIGVGIIWSVIYRRHVQKQME
ncbi:intracellular septation protein A [Paenibacillus baekrokdamisoli]|nr:intracellular septation protein A [Paenibacillus baekrokdamisoli]